MGAQVSTATRLAPLPVPDSLVELGNIQYEKSMGTSRFLKTIRARHQQGALIVKVLVKPDPNVSLRHLQRKINAEIQGLSGCPNILSYGRATETERAGYLVRQWILSNLYDRISTRPFLSVVEKKWIAYQLLAGLAAAHERNIYHGDIKTENVLVTSWNWVYLSDFASFKPTYLPLDDPTIYGIYFDTSSRRTCYIAPERFYASNSDIASRIAAAAVALSSSTRTEYGRQEGNLTPEMDIFAMGCVLAELWMEGTPIFTLSQLFKYREGQFSPDAYLAEIEDEDVRALIRSMVSLDPEKRMSAQHYLETSRGRAFPEVFYSFLHPFVSSISESTVTAPQPAAASLKMSTSSIVGVSTTGTSTPVQGDAAQAPKNNTIRSDADERIERIWSEWETIGPLLGDGKVSSPVIPQEGGQLEDRRPEAAETSKAGAAGQQKAPPPFPLQMDIPGLEGVPVGQNTKEVDLAQIILSLVYSNIRNCVKPASVLKAMQILTALVPHLGDEVKLDRVVPYLIYLLEDDSASVRATAVRVLTQTLLLVTTITPSNAAIFPEYIFVNTLQLCTDTEVLPRVAYAECLAYLAQTASRFLEMTEAMKAEGTFKPAPSEGLEDVPDEANYAAMKRELQEYIQEHVGILLIDPSSVVKRALLSQIAPICSLLERARANDAVLAHLITYLNDRDWLLRAAFYEHAVGIVAIVGLHSFDEYVLPLMVLGLADAEEAVVSRVLASLTVLVDKGYITSKARMFELVGHISGFACHPNLWIREGSASFMESVARKLPVTDKWCILYPTLKRLLRADITEITASLLLHNAREPLSRVVFEAAVTWATKSKSSFWNPPTAKQVQKGAPRDASVQTDEDNAHLEKLKQLGMGPEDILKVTSMKDYIVKLARARQMSPSRLVDVGHALLKPGGAQLPELKIPLESIFYRLLDASDVSHIAQHLAPPLPTDNLRRLSFESPRSIASQDRFASHARVMSDSSMTDEVRRRLALDEDGTEAGGSQAGGSGITLRGLDAMSGDGDGAGLDATVVRPPALRNDSITSSESLALSPHRRLPGAKIRSRINTNGVEIQRMSPAIVAPSTTNVMGLINLESRSRPDEGVKRTLSSTFARSVSQRLIPETATPSRRFWSTYEGTDPAVWQLIERTYFDHHHEKYAEFGELVSAGPARRGLRGAGGGGPHSSRERNLVRPEGTLVAHLAEHTSSIKAIAVAPDHAFFASGSLDGTVKIWDTVRLEKNVTSRSRHTFKQGGKITDVCMLEKSHCVVSASDNGTLWIHRVDVNAGVSMPKYGKANLIRQYKVEPAGDYITALKSYNTETTTNVVFSTHQGALTILDVLTMRPLHHYQNPLHYGPVTALCVDNQRCWLVAGTSSGVLTLWDMRFGLQLRTWTVGQGPVSQISEHPTKGDESWVVIASGAAGRLGEQEGDGGVLLQTWSLDLGVKVEDYVTSSATYSNGGSSLRHALRRTSTATTADSVEASEPPDAAAAIERLLRTGAPRLPPPGRAPDKTPPSVYSFATGRQYSSSGAATTPATISEKSEGEKEAAGGKKGAAAGVGGFIITGGEDRKLRFWDLAKAERSAIVSGLDVDDERPSFHYSAGGKPRVSSTSTSSAVFGEYAASGQAQSKPHRSTVVRDAQAVRIRTHGDAITAVARLESPFKAVVTGDREGIIRVFE